MPSTMKHFILLMLFLLIIGSLSAQGGGSMAPSKPVVDSPSFFKWPVLGNTPAPAISNNGHFAFYTARNIPPGRHSFTVQALNGSKKIVLSNVQQAAFTDDSRYATILNSGDSLCLLTLSNYKKTYITGVTDFRLFMRNNEEWLAYTVKEPEKRLVLKNVSTGAETIYKNVDNYLLSENAHSLILQTTPGTDSSRSIRWVNLSTNSDREIWKGKWEDNLILNHDGSQLAFLVRDSNSAVKTLWLYRSGEEKARGNTSPIPQNMELDAIQGFSKDGSKLFVQLRNAPLPKKVPPMVPINIWSYTDAMLQSQQLRELHNGLPSYLAVLDITASSSCRRLQFEDEVTGIQTDSLLLLSLRRGEPTEYYWNKEAVGSTFLVTINTGNRTEIPINRPIFSPRGKYVIGFHSDDFLTQDLHVYEIATGTTRNITSNMPIPQQDDEFHMLSTEKSRGLSVAGWLPNDAALLVCDRYDIWQIDPTGVRPPLNLTNGRKDKWQFRPAGKELAEGVGILTTPTLILSGFNENTKQNAFYKLTLGRARGLELLFVGDYRFQKFISMNGFCYAPKARDANVYLVKRESATESPNIFATTDFKSFTQLSKVEPEKSVNWLTRELISFNTLDGLPSQAILYKPENFDPSKKYPMIIQYYDKKSDELNWYRRPVVDNGGELDIPWFVSRGYLVLLPDIQYKIGEPGPSALKTVEGAAYFMMKRPYIDKDHIGIQGHSFGGYETNYIATHSKIFAAVMSSAGACNVTSDYGNVWPSDASRQEYWEVRDGRIGSTPWENPDLYVKNSPLFNINNVTAPILLMQNRNDKNVHFVEGLQFFTGLRRAGKRCWMLEYDNGGHGVFGNEYKDFLLRMNQFFDHYLKGAPAPKWMTRGISASMKGVDNGLELDTEIATPGSGLLIDQQKPIVNSILSGWPNRKINK